MACIGAKNWDDVNNHMKSLQQFSTTQPFTSTRHIAQSMGIPVCQAIAHYGRMEYEKVVELIAPLRYQCMQLTMLCYMNDV